MATVFVKPSRLLRGVGGQAIYLSIHPFTACYPKILENRVVLFAPENCHAPGARSVDRQTKHTTWYSVLGQLIRATDAVVSLPLCGAVLLHCANAFTVSAATGPAPVASGLATMIGAVGAGLFDVTSNRPVSAEKHHFTWTLQWTLVDVIQAQGACYPRPGEIQTASPVGSAFWRRDCASGRTVAPELRIRLCESLFQGFSLPIRGLICILLVLLTSWLSLAIWAGTSLSCCS